MTVGSSSVGKTIQSRMLTVSSDRDLAPNQRWRAMNRGRMVRSEDRPFATFEQRFPAGREGEPGNRLDLVGRELLGPADRGAGDGLELEPDARRRARARGNTGRR